MARTGIVLAVAGAAGLGALLLASRSASAAEDDSSPIPPPAGGGGGGGGGGGASAAQRAQWAAQAKAHPLYGPFSQAESNCQVAVTSTDPETIDAYSGSCETAQSLWNSIMSDLGVPQSQWDAVYNAL